MGQADVALNNTQICCVAADPLLMKERYFLFFFFFFFAKSRTIYCGEDGCEKQHRRSCCYQRHNRNHGDPYSSDFTVR
jgi:hypothetical protein